MCEFRSQPVSAVHARCGLCAVAWDQADPFQRLWVVTRYHFHLPWKSNPYRCTYQRVQDKNQSWVCQRPSHKRHDEDGTPKSIVKRLTYIYGCPYKLWGLIFHAFFWTDHAISRVCIVLEADWILRRLTHESMHNLMLGLKLIGLLCKAMKNLG